MSRVYLYNNTRGVSEKPIEEDFLFKTDEGKIHIITKENIYISKEKTGANITIIGTDFLEENNMILYYDPRNESYLEVKEN